MTATNILWANERDVSTAFWFHVRRMSGLADVSITWPTTTFAGRAGVVPTTPDAVRQPREIVVAGIIQGTNANDVLLKSRALVAWCLGGQVELRTGHAPRVRYYARLTQASLPVLDGGQLTRDWTDVELHFVCHDPYGYDDGALPYGVFSGKRTILPLGTGPSTPIIKWSDGSDPVFTYRDAWGNVQGTMGFIYTPAANDFLLIDCHQRDLFYSKSGVSSRAIELLTSAFLVFDPRHGNIEQGLYPTLEVSSGRAEVFVRRSYR